MKIRLSACLVLVILAFSQSGSAANSKSSSDFLLSSARISNDQSRSRLAAMLVLDAVLHPLNSEIQLCNNSKPNAVESSLIAGGCHNPTSAACKTYCKKNTEKCKMIGIAYPQDSFSCPIDLRLPRNEKYACVAKCYSTIFENYKPYNPEEYNSDSSLPEDPDLYDSTIRSFIYELQNTGCLQYFCDIRYIRPEVCVIFESVAQAIKSGNVTDGGICKELNRSANGKPANLIKTRAARIICSEDIN